MGMLTEQRQTHSVRQSDSSNRTLTSLAEVQKDLLDARRDLLRWKIIARQREERLKEIEESLPRSYLMVARIARELRRRWKLFLLLAIAALISLPFWPLALIVACFPAGRRLLWSLIAKVGPLRRLSTDIQGGILWAKSQIRKTPARNDASRITPLIYHRPDRAGQSADNASDEHLRWLALQQLSPQRRLLLQRFGLSRADLINQDEMPQVLSLSRSEVSLLNVVAVSRATSGVNHGKHP
jgi:hypothetical protein